MQAKRKSYMSNKRQKPVIRAPPFFMAGRFLGLAGNFLAITVATKRAARYLGAVCFPVGFNHAVLMEIWPANGPCLRFSALWLCFDKRPGAHNRRKYCETGDWSFIGNFAAPFY